MSVSVLVPYRPGGCEWRARAWAYVRAHYGQLHGGWELVVGSCAGRWSKGAAVADALGRATGEVLVLADADSFCDPDVLAGAVAGVAGGRYAWAVPHRLVYRLSRRGTERLYGGQLQPGHVARKPYLGPAGGGIVVLPRAAYEAVGGIDERYLGWGGEDVSLGWALDALVGPYHRHGARLYHLWHPHPAPSHRGSPPSEALAARYRAARTNPDLMSALVRERNARTP